MNYRPNPVQRHLLTHCRQQLYRELAGDHGSNYFILINATSADCRRPLRTAAPERIICPTGSKGRERWTVISRRGQGSLTRQFSTGVRWVLSLEIVFK